MVQLMSSAMAEANKSKGGSKKPVVKFEVDDSSESLEPIHKRPKFNSLSLQVSILFPFLRS